ncbi:MAG: dihydropteroate synthase [Actinomycetota bacterium]|nr:dihydropteroate synthase [Actinomycetota bacterium]
MGVLNVTPDSFSDGGAYLDASAAIAQGERLLAEGADILDVGGESTRPGAGRVDADEERRRVLPVVRALAGAGAVVSVDTMRAETAAAALDAGAAIVNDVSGGLADEAMPRLVAGSGVPYVAMHWRGHSDTMQQRSSYADVVTDVRRDLAARLHALAAAGVDPEQVVLDPGLGFAKQPEDNWPLLARLEDLQGLGRPLLVGASRKAFLGRVLAVPGGTPRPAEDRDDATAAVSALAAAAGAWCVRVHAVRATRDAVEVAAAVCRARVGDVGAGRRRAVPT